MRLKLQHILAVYHRNKYTKHKLNIPQQKEIKLPNNLKINNYRFPIDKRLHNLILLFNWQNTQF